MHTIAPMTKLALTVFVTIWAIVLQSLPALTLLIICQILILISARVSRTVYKGIASLFVFAALLAGMQYLINHDTLLAAVTASKMIAMTLVFFILLATTRMQDLSAALVMQCHIPYEYAFMLTAALRFIPDFLAEITAIQEAQACRGYAPQGNLIQRFFSYMAIIKPLVLKAVTRSETMALSLELRGFGSRKVRSFGNKVALNIPDYALLLSMVTVTSYLIIQIH
ncbi:energy-coupling factor transporter transmembrane component T family protein [Pelosinus sp. sgz500959]|uniref:energy-coupling factor transporter transmembrane component T family protein n=1 Tax=Pelosinus sp. sgz500959 TaxID=3242472 RepID=UPI00366E6419